MSNKMGRPHVYNPDKPRRQRLIMLTDELWDALGKIAGDGKRTLYIEEQLRSIPEVRDSIDKKK